MRGAKVDAPEGGASSPAPQLLYDEGLTSRTREQPPPAAAHLQGRGRLQGSAAHDPEASRGLAGAVGPREHVFRVCYIPCSYNTVQKGNVIKKLLGKGCPGGSAVELRLLLLAAVTVPGSWVRAGQSPKLGAAPA